MFKLSVGIVIPKKSSLVWELWLEFVEMDMSGVRPRPPFSLRGKLFGFVFFPSKFSVFVFSVSSNKFLSFLLIITGAFVGIADFIKVWFNFNFFASLAFSVRFDLTWLTGRFLVWDVIFLFGWLGMGRGLGLCFF